MKRPYAVLIIVCLTASCRSSQPTTNPFLRTTVPPPTTPGVVVTPGQPYAAGIAPPLVTSPAPAPIVTGPPVVTTPAPMGAPAPAPVMAPPPTSNQGEQFKPPGGSYLFHQSSNQPQPTINPTAPQLAAASPSSGGVVQVAFSQPLNTQAPQPMQTLPPGGVVINPYVKNASTATSGAATSSTATTPAPSLTSGLAPAPGLAPPVDRSSPVAASGTVAIGGAQPQNAIRIVGPSANQAATSQPKFTQPVATTSPFTIPASSQPNVPSTAGTPVIRMTVGDPQPMLKSMVGGSPPATTPGFVPASSNLSIANAPAGQTTASFIAPTAANSAAQPGVVRAGFQPSAGGATSDYAHSADYTLLRGKLEYSQTSREWKLRYIPIDGQTDDFGGSVVLNNSPLLAGFKVGEMVALRGVLSAAGNKAAGYAPHYSLTAIERTSR